MQKLQFPVRFQKQPRDTVEGFHEHVRLADAGNRNAAVTHLSVGNAESWGSFVIIQWDGGKK